MNQDPPQAPLVLGLAFSNGGTGLLETLRQAGVVSEWVGPEALPSCQETLSSQWSRASGFVIVGACGLVTRLVAPLLHGKDTDPAVVVLDGQGSFAIPLLGGHRAGADQLSQRVAAVLGSQVVLTGSSGSGGRLALDSFGEAWGWRRGPGGDWKALMQRAAEGLRVTQASGNKGWQGLAAADHCQPGAEPDLWVGTEQGPGCRWHTPSLWLGLGCERGTSRSLIERLVDESLAKLQLAPEAVAGMASIDRKADEEGLLALAKGRLWPQVWLTAETLAAIEVPNPSQVVAGEMGTASVAEASALGAAGPGAHLLLTKTIGRPLDGERGAATLAIAATETQWAPQRGQLHLVGSGPGRLDLLTADARRALAEATVWVGYGLYLDLLEPLRRPDQLRCDGRLTEERARCALALDLANQGLKVALVSSGDSGIYAMAGLALELWLNQDSQQRPSFEVHPGISALQLAAARAGAPLMHDFCTISLSDRLTPWPVIEQRLKAAASGDFVVALYNPRSLGREWQLGRAQEILLTGRPGQTPVALARQLGRPEEKVSLHSLAELPIEQVDMLTLVLIGNSSSYAKDGLMVTPRGYPGAEIS
ncbi:precorrin-3B C(17)-methyltransferase [Cyanobium sp. WAJ14-Wanaka]|uniref:precorrin-3B C(17)-methyltransferase n=1 Tax=Cyanobium sp. WAJ14-Wanaka TaxID=2823725 RepID=UPI0020CF9DF1|nr:precorrin-3B C(17)-methyltransferase [Cyanobium sp. WAJ14-Wanaka]